MNDICLFLRRAATIMGDPVRARKQETSRLFASSSSMWSAYVTLSAEMHSLPADTVNLSGTLGHVPAYLYLTKDLVQRPLQLGAHWLR